MDIPKIKEFNMGVAEFRKHEKRNAMYKVASFMVSYFWDKPAEIADGLGVLLLTWNQAFYRYGLFDFDKLEECIKNTYPLLNEFRKRNIFDFSNNDGENIERIFNQFLDALQIDSGKMKGRKSPVAVAKTLHLLAPNFFPLWDDKIARAYNCHYNRNAAKQYICFCKVTKVFSEKMEDKISYNDWSILKIIDEYNYSKFTKHWI